MTDTKSQPPSKPKRKRKAQPQPQEPAPRAFYTVKELQERWRCSHMMIYREMKRGRLECKRIGGLLRFAAEEVERYERQA